MKSIKKLAAVCLLLICTTIAFGQKTDFPYETDREIKLEKLVVKDLGTGTYVLVSTADENKRYFAVNLPDALKQDGLLLSCSGIVGKIPPNVRMLGTPLKLSFVKVGKNAKKYKLKTKSYVLN